MFSKNKRSRNINIVIKRVLAAVLSLTLILGNMHMATIKPEAMEITAENFNPKTNSLELSFDLQLTQPVDIEVLADGEHFGYIERGKLLTGFDGDMYAKPKTRGVSPHSLNEALPEEKAEEPEESVDTESSKENEDKDKDDENPSVPEEESTSEIGLLMVNRGLISNAMFSDESQIILPETEEEKEQEEIKEETKEENTHKTEDKPKEATDEENKREKEESEDENLKPNLNSSEEDMITNVKAKPVPARSSNISTYASTWEEERPGHHKLIWDGRIGEYPVKGQDPKGDRVAVTVIIQPLGYPERDTDIWDWKWSRAYPGKITFYVDYALGQYVAVKMGFRDDMYEVFTSQGLEGLIEAFPELDLEVNTEDPVNMLDGSYNFNYQDLRIGDIYTLSFKRFYTSTYDEGSLGKGFTHGYEYKLVDDRGIINITAPGGYDFSFIRVKDGSEDIYHTVQSNGFTLKDQGSGFLLTEKNGTKMYFDSDGNLYKILNPSGIEIANLTYSSSDELIKIEGIPGSYNLEWEDGYISKVTDSSGRVNSYEYDNDNLIKVTNPDGHSVNYEYDSNGYLKKSYDFEGDLFVENNYDDKGRVTKQTFINADVSTVSTFDYEEFDPYEDIDENTYHKNTHKSSTGRSKEYYFNKYYQIIDIKDTDGNDSNGYSNKITKKVTNKKSDSLEYEFNDDEQVTSVKYPDGNEIEYTYTGTNDHLVETITYKDGSTEKYTYDGNDKPTSFKDRNENTTYFTYNSLGLIEKIRDPLGNETLRTYDTKGMMLSETDPEGGVFTYTYDAAGRLKKTIDEIGAETKYEYSPAGKLLSITDDEGNVTSYTYTNNGYTETITNPDGGVTGMKYGTNWQILERKDPLGNTAKFKYDKNGFLSLMTDAEGNTIKYEYDNKGRISKSIDAELNETEYKYNEIDQLVEEIDALGGVKKYAYDSMGREVSITDENEGVTENTYDILGRLKEVKDPEGGVKSYSYDYNGNVTSVKDEEGVITYTSYDECNRVKSETDGVGNVTSYTYDNAGRVKSVSRVLTLTGENEVTSYTYDKAGNVLTTTDPMGYVSSFEYNKLGQKIIEINKDNTRKRYVYDNMGREKERYDELDNVTSFEYDLCGNLTSQTDPMGNVTHYTYNRNNQQYEVENPDNGVTKTYYTPLGSIKTYKDANGNETNYLYDKLGRAKTVTDGEGKVTEYEYDPIGNVTLIKIDDNVVSKSYYDLLNREKEREDGLGNRSYITYNKVGMVTKREDREGNITLYTYDKNYRLTVTENALGYTSKVEYDSLGRVVREIDEENNKTSYTYNLNGNILTTKDALGNIVVNEYDKSGRVVTVKDKRGITEVTNTYLANGNLEKSKDAKDVYRYYTYDKNGNMITFIDKDNTKMAYEYDSMNRLIKETNHLHHANKYTYDYEGNLIELSNRNHNKAVYKYDKVNRLIKETDEEGGIKEESYHYLGGVKTRTIYGGENQRAVTSYEYDKGGNLISITEPKGQLTTFTYDKESHVVSKKDANCNETKYEYDEVYRLSKRTDVDGVAAFKYDNVGNLKEADDNTGVTSFIRDSVYRTTKVTDGKAREINYEYDANGNLLKKLYPDNKEVEYIYDELNNVKKLRDHDNSNIVYFMDPVGRVIKEEHSDNSTTEYDYNNAGLLTQLKEVDKNHTTRREILYGYDDEGNLLSETRRGVDIDRKGQSVLYRYDKANRLIKSITDGKERKYTYDLAGNILKDNDTTYRYDIQNRLTEKIKDGKKITYEYDPVGNLITETGSDGTKSYKYDGQNKLIKGTNEKGETSEYTYNSLGIRVGSKQVRENVNVGHANEDMIRGSERIDDYLKALSDDRHTWQKTWESEVNTTVQNDPETIEREYVTDPLSPANSDIMVYEKGSYIQRYVYNINGERISSEYSYNHETNRATPGENIISDIAAGDVKKIYYRRSMLDSTLIAVDKEGDIISHVIYDEWGTPLTETRLDENYSGIDNINNFTGYTYDEVLKTYYAQNRFYDPENHRFTQEDRALDGTNWYSYCNSNPLTNIDPLGMWHIQVGDWYSDKLVKDNYCKDGFVSLRELLDVLQKRGHSYSDIGGGSYKTRASSYYQVNGNVTVNYNNIGTMYYNMTFNVTNKKDRYEAKGTIVGKKINYFDALLCKDTAYVNFNQFIKALGLSGKYKLVSQIDLSAIFNFGSFNIDSTVKEKIKNYYLNDAKVKANVDKGGVSIFAFEGKGSYYKKAEWQNTEAHKTGRYGALFIVLQGGKVTYTTSKASTLPDNPAKASSVNEGVYAYRSDQHGGYLALRYKPNENTWTHYETMPAVLKTGKPGTATQINIHAGGDSPDFTWSKGCQMVHYDDYISFGQAVGFIPAGIKPATGYGDVKTKTSEYLNKTNPVDVLYILDRSNMPYWQQVKFHYKK